MVRRQGETRLLQRSSTAGENWNSATALPSSSLRRSGPGFRALLCPRPDCPSKTAWDRFSTIWHHQAATPPALLRASSASAPRASADAGAARAASEAGSTRYGPSCCVTTRQLAADREPDSAVFIPAIRTAPATSIAKIRSDATKRSNPLLATIMPHLFCWRGGGKMPRR